MEVVLARNLFQHHHDGDFDNYLDQGPSRAKASDRFRNRCADRHCQPTGLVKNINLSLENCECASVLAILDIDHFKQINDTYGHDAGDKALIDLTHLVKLELPANAMIGRMGGEEFAIYLFGALYDHNAILERVRRRVEKTSFDYKGLPINFSVSIGYASVEMVGKSFDHLFAAADCAMYMAKKEGRNRVLAYKPSMRIREVLEDGFKDYSVFSDPSLTVKAL